MVRLPKRCSRSVIACVLLAASPFGVSGSAQAARSTAAAPADVAAAVPAARPDAALFVETILTAKSTTKKSTAKKSTTKTSATKKSATKKSATKKSATKKSTTKKSTPTSKLQPVQTFTVPTGPMGEISGCAVTPADPGTVWLHNDSGNSAQLFGLNLSTRAVRTVEVPGAVNVDWEDLAPTPGGGLLIADIGDNERSRTSVDFYEVSGLSSGDAKALRRRYVYEDGAHNAEAIVVDPGVGTDHPSVYVITKEETGVSGVYITDGTTLRRIGGLTIKGEVLIVPNQITGAAALVDGSGVIVRTYHYAYLLRRPKGRSFEASFTADPVRIQVPFLPQAESVCVTPDGMSAITTTESRGAPSISFVVFPLPM